jgi:outer membrane immunogenic protein
MNRWIGRTLLSGVSVAALNCSAFAADMPIKAPPAILAAPYSWTGFYGGIHAGVGWPVHRDGSATAQTFTDIPVTIAQPLQSLDAKSNPFPFGGIQVGYNWRLGERWLVGTEADFSWSSPTQSAGVLTNGSSIANDVIATRGLDWFGTVRGRAGYLINPSLLAYATGGLAYGRTRNEFSQTITGPSIFAIPTGTLSVSVLDRASNVSVGWTAGAGLEWALDRKWSVKFEYDYLAFDDGVVSSTEVIFTSGAKGGSFRRVSNVHGPDNSVHAFQVGLNYHFWD